jgi:hypothetical protein
METKQHCLGYTPLDTEWGNDATDDGYYSLNQNITRALATRNHLGYYSKAAPWEGKLSDFGYYSLNGSIARALRNLSGHS